MAYEESSGLYYDYKSGYYFDAQRSLYYDGNSGTYYSYNYEVPKRFVTSICPCFTSDFRTKFPRFCFVSYDSVTVITERMKPYFQVFWIVWDSNPILSACELSFFPLKSFAVLFSVDTLQIFLSHSCKTIKIPWLNLEDILDWKDVTEDGFLFLVWWMWRNM